MQKERRGNVKIPSPVLPFRMAFEYLPVQAQAQLHSAAATVEDKLVEELGRGYEDVARVQGIGVCVLVERPIVAWQADAVILVVERIEGLEAELHRRPL